MLPIPVGLQQREVPDMYIKYFYMVWETNGEKWRQLLAHSWGERFEICPDPGMVWGQLCVMERKTPSDMRPVTAFRGGARDQGQMKK